MKPVYNLAHWLNLYKLTAQDYLNNLKSKGSALLRFYLNSIKQNDETFSESGGVVIVNKEDIEGKTYEIGEQFIVECKVAYNIQESENSLGPTSYDNKVEVMNYGDEDIIEEERKAPIHVRKFYKKGVPFFAVKVLSKEEAKLSFRVPYMGFVEGEDEELIPILSHKETELIINGNSEEE